MGSQHERVSCAAAAAAAAEAAFTHTTCAPLKRPLQAAERGAAAVVAAGGDGLANEVISGLMAAREAARGAGSMPRFGLLPIGSGNDFAKTHGW